MKLFLSWFQLFRCTDVDGCNVIDDDLDEDGEENENLDEREKLTQSCFELRAAHTRRLASPLGSHTHPHTRVILGHRSGPRESHGTQM